MISELKRAEELLTEGKQREAKCLLLSLLEQDPNNAEAHNNLGVLSFMRGDAEGAIQHFRQSLRIDPLNRDALANFREILQPLNKMTPVSENNHLHVAKSAVETEVEARLPAVITGTVSSPLKVAFLCMKDIETFLENIVGYFKGLYNVRTCYTLDVEEMKRTIKWADVVWLEWANELTVSLTNHSNILAGKHVICRLHSYEAFSPFIHQVAWEKIDDLIFVANHIRQVMEQQIPFFRNRMRNIYIIPNGVNLEKFPFKSRGKGEHIAFLGGINFKKGPMLLLHAFLELLKNDSSYQLHVGGMIQDLRYLLYFKQLAREMGILDKIHFEGKIGDVPRWFEDKNYIICTSVLESQYMAIMEAMACGIKPLIHNFVGARDIYPSQFIWNTMDELLKLAQEDTYDSKTYRSWVEENYSLERQLRSLQGIFDTVPSMHASMKCNRKNRSS